jgi:hypothetical protein
MRAKLTYANVMSTIAVFLALAGGVAIGKKLIKGKQIKNGAISTKKLKNLAVTEGKLADKAVTTGKIGDKQVKQGKIGTGAVNTDKLDDKAVTAAKTDFASIGLLKSGRVTSNPDVGAELKPNLISAAGVVVQGRCVNLGTPGNTQAEILAGAPSGNTAAGVYSADGSTVLDGYAGSLSPTPGTVGPAVSAVSVEHRVFLDLHVVTTTGTLSFTAFAAINSQGNACVFSANGIAG